MPDSGTESDSDEEPTVMFARPPLADMWHLARAEHVPVEDVKFDPTPDSEAQRDPEITPAIAARSQLLSTIAELEAAVTDKTDEFEPDGSEPTPVVDWAQTTANGAIFGARAATTRISDLAGAAEPQAMTKHKIEDTAPFEEDDDADDEILVIADRIAESETDVLAARIDEDLSDFLNAETTVDEAALREIVADIVRKELQGPLGERITRNVRNWFGAKFTALWLAKSSANLSGHRK